MRWLTRVGRHDTENIQFSATEAKQLRQPTGDLPTRANERSAALTYEYEYALFINHIRLIFECKISILER